MNKRRYKWDHPIHNSPLRARLVALLTIPLMKNAAFSEREIDNVLDVAVKGSQRHSLLLGMLACIGAAIAFVSITSAAPALTQPPSAPMPTPTEIPPPLGLLIDPNLFVQELPALQPQADLIVGSVAADRTHYLIGMTWSVDFEVRNIGDLTLDEFQATWSICRFAIPTDWMLSCSPPEVISGSTGISLDPGDFVQLSSGPHPFDGTPADDPPFFPSALTGIPDSSFVFLTIDVVPLNGGVEAPQFDRIASNNRAMASVIYPSGPENPSYNPDQDLDGDGWSSADGDCTDENPDVYPWHGEVESNGFDDDCSGGDVDDIPECPSEFYPMEHLETTECLPPPGWPSPASVPIGSDPIPYGNSDADADGYTPYDGDCDDTNSAIHPTATEIEDLIDNDCDGLIDEGFLTPDWELAQFDLWRGYGRPATGGTPLSYPGGWRVPVFRYGVEVINVGDSLTNCVTRGCASQEGSFVEPWVLLQDLEASIVRYGSRGYFYYQEFNYGAGFNPACHAFGLIATLPGGLYQELIINNNTAIASVADLGGVDRDLFFDGDPVLTLNDPSNVNRSIHVATSGQCPGSLQFYSGIGILVPSSTIPYRVDLFINGSWLEDDDFIYTEADSYPFFELPEPLHRGDIVCMRVAIDPHGWLMEVDEGNNIAVQIYEYRNPLFGSPRLEQVESHIGLPAPSCAVAYVTTGGGAGINGALVEQGLIIVLVLGLGFMGGLGGFILGRIRDLASSTRVLVILGGFAVGGVIGGGIGSTLRDAPPEGTSQPLSPDPVAFQEVTGLGSCDTFLDPGNSNPPEAAVFEPNSPDIVLQQLEALDAPEPAPDHFLVEVIDPAGQQIYIAWDQQPGTGGLGPIPLGQEFHRELGDYQPPAGMYQWSIRSGKISAADGDDPYITLCQGSTPHSFVLLPEPTATPTATPTPTPTSTPTPTITPTPIVTSTYTPVPDTSGPKVGGVNDSPDPVFTNGNSPDTSTVSATVIDPSGVASVTLYYRSGSKGGFQIWGAMSGSGGSYSTGFGPFGSAGAYEYRIYAVDNLGNANCSKGSIDVCPGGTLTVTIP